MHEHWSDDKELADEAEIKKLPKSLSEDSPRMILQLSFFLYLGFFYFFIRLIDAGRRRRTLILFFNFLSDIIAAKRE